MAKGSGRGMGLSENCVMFSVVVLNVLCGLLGALLFALSIWMRVENEVREWVYELGMYQYWNGLYILMAASLIIIFLSFCGCCGALVSNVCLLGTSAILTVVAIILELAGGIYIVVNGTERSSLTPWLESRFTRLLTDSIHNDKANSILRIIHENVGCCGSISYQDYDRSGMPVPDYCRDKITGNVYQDGCVNRFSIFVEKRAGWIAGIAIFIGFLQLILAGFTFCHWRNIRNEDDSTKRRTKYDGIPTHVQ